MVKEELTRLTGCGGWCGNQLTVLVIIDGYSVEGLDKTPRARAAPAVRAKQRVFQCDRQIAAPEILQPPSKSGFHVVAVGCVTTGKHTRMHRMFARVMHEEFDQL